MVIGTDICKTTVIHLPCRQKRKKSTRTGGLYFSLIFSVYDFSRLYSSSGENGALIHVFCFGNSCYLLNNMTFPLSLMYWKQNKLPNKILRDTWLSQEILAHSLLLSFCFSNKAAMLQGLKSMYLNSIYLFSLGFWLKAHGFKMYRTKYTKYTYHMK